MAGLTLLGVAGFVVIVVLAGLAWANTRWGRNWIRQQVVEAGQTSMPGFAIGRLGGFLPFSVVLQDVRLDDLDGQFVMSIERVFVDPDLWSLLRGRLGLDHLRIDRPVLHVSQSAQGAWNVQHAVRPRRPTAPLPALHVDLLRVVDGFVLVSQRGTTTAELRNIRVRASGAIRRNELQVEATHLALAYAAQGRTGELNATLKTHVDERQIRSALTASLTGLAEAGAIPIALSVQGERQTPHLSLQAGTKDVGEIEGTADVDLRTLSYEARLTLKSLDPRAIGSSLPRGDINLGLLASGRGVPLQGGTTLELKLASSGTALAGVRLDSLNVDASTKGPHWTLASLSMQGPQVSVNARGKGEGASFALTAQVAAEGLRARAKDQELFAQGKAELSVHRPQGGPLDMQASVRIGQLDYGETRVRDLVVHLDGEVNRTLVGWLRLRSPTPFQVNGVRIAHLRFLARADDESLRVRGQVTPGRANQRAASLLSTLPLRRDAQGRLQGLALDEPMHGELRWARAHLEPLFRLLGSQASVRGRLSLGVRVAGTLAAPHARARLDLHQAALGAREPMNARALITSDQDRSTAAVSAWLRGQAVLRARASIAAGLQTWAQQEKWMNAPLTGEAQVPPVDARSLAGAFPVLKGVPERLSVRLTIRGSVEQPQLSLSARTSPTRREGPQLTLRLGAQVRDGRTHADGSLDVDSRPAVRLTATSSATPAELMRGSASASTLKLEGSMGPLALERLGELHPALQPFVGRVSGTWSLSGTLPNLSGSAELHGGGLRVNGRSLGELRVAMDLDRGHAVLQAGLGQPSGGAVLNASLNRHGEARVELRANTVDLDALGTLSPSWPLADGRVSGQVTASGSVVASGGAAPLQRLFGPRQVVGRVEATGVRLSLYINREEPAGREEPRAATKPLKPTRLSIALERALPFRLVRLSVSDAEIRLVDATLEGHPAITLGEAALTLENLASRKSFMKRMPTVIGFRARVQSSGMAVGFATLDPLAPVPLAAGRAKLTGLRLAELNPFLRPALDAKATQGTLASYVAFRIIGNTLEGGIKPVVANPKIEPAATSSWIESLGIDAADALADIFESGQRRAIVTVIPIQGTVSDPRLGMVTAVLAAIRNAFVVGIASGFSRLPPPTAERQQSIFTRAMEALSVKSFPKAQPRKD